MKQDRLSTAQYKISGDPTLLDEVNHITPEVRRVLDEIRPDVEKGRKYLDKKLNKLCLKYPRVPVFKNILSTFYEQQGNTKQAFAVNQWLVKEHPQYLFGKLNLAAELLAKEEPEKIPEILGEYMDIGQLYPGRKEFHLEEVIGLNMIAIQYFLAVDKVEDAELRIEILEELDEDHPKTHYAKQHLEAWYISHAAERLENEKQMRKQAVWKDNRSHLQTTKAPQFHFAEQIGWLYENDLGISHDKIEQILKLDPKKLTEDLEKMLQDSIARFEYFIEEVEENGFDNSKMDFPIHALLLLGELKSKKSLPSILQLLKQDDEFLQVWFGDSITHVVENALYHCGKDQTNHLFDFLKLPNIYHGSIAHVGSSLVKIIERSEEKREIFIEEYRRVLKVLIENADDENFADTETTAFLINDLVDLGYEELLPEIKQLFDLELVGVYIYDSYEDVEIDIKKESFWDSTEFEDNTIYEKYGELSILEKNNPGTSTQHGSTDLYNREMQKEPFYSDPFNKPYINPNKAGRNDPCPCGSGKKYKKCCL